MPTKEKIAATVGMIHEGFGRVLTAPQLRAFEIGLEGVSDADLDRAAAQVLREDREHPPSPGQLRAIALQQTEADHRAAAIEAFEKADRLARREGVTANWRTALGDPAAVHAIGECGGWVNFCRGKISEWDRRSFVKSYVEAAGNPALAEVARISYSKAVGALADHRERMAASLALPAPAENQA